MTDFVSRAIERSGLVFHSESFIREHLGAVGALESIASKSQGQADIAMLRLEGVLSDLAKRHPWLVKGTRSQESIGAPRAVATEKDLRDLARVRRGARSGNPADLVAHRQLRQKFGI